MTDLFHAYVIQKAYKTSEKFGKSSKDENGDTFSKMLEIFLAKKLNVTVNKITQSVENPLWNHHSHSQTMKNKIHSLLLFTLITHC